MAALCVGLISGAAAQAQDSTEIETLRRELETLREAGEVRERRMEELEERLAEAERRQEDDEEVGDESPVGTSNDLWSRELGRSRLRLMNLGVDVLAAVGSSSERGDTLEDLQAGAHDPNQRGFSLTQLELSMTGAVDPYLRGDAFVTFRLDQDGETETELEEAFFTTLSLPWSLHELGFEIEGGTFLTEFGRVNPTHVHTWFFIDQPLVASRLLGGDGLRGPGARLGWLTPLPWYSELHLGMQNANGETQVSFLANSEVFDERPIGGRPFVDNQIRSTADFTYLVRWVNGIDAGDEWSMQVGASGLFGPNATGSGADTMILGGDFVAKWRPLQSDRGWPYLNIEGEFMWRDYDAERFVGALEQDDGSLLPVVLPSSSIQDWGFYGQVIWGFTRRWSAGARYGYADADGANFDRTGARVSHNTDPYRSRRHRITPLVIFDPSEFSRIRLQYSYDNAKHLSGDDAHSVWLGVEISFGAHPAHTY